MQKTLGFLTVFILAFTLLVYAQTDLGVSKADSPDPVVLGDIVTHTIVMTNFGPTEATNVVLGEALPASMTFQSISAPEDWACTAPPADTTGAISCSKLQVASGETATFSISVKPTNAGMITNIATVSSAEPDPNPDNNTSSQETMVLSAEAPDNSVLGRLPVPPYPHYHKPEEPIDADH